MQTIDEILAGCGMFEGMASVPSIDDGKDGADRRRRQAPIDRRWEGRRDPAVLLTASLVGCTIDETSRTPGSMKLDRATLFKLGTFTGVAALAATVHALGLGEHAEGILGAVLALAGSGAHATIWPPPASTS